MQRGWVRDLKPNWRKKIDFNFFDRDLEVRPLVKSTAQPSCHRIVWHSVQNK